jgi:hypothetical protein
MANVTDASWMFRDASRFNQPLDSWNMANVTDAGGMFHGAKRATIWRRWWQGLPQRREMFKLWFRCQKQDVVHVSTKHATEQLEKNNLKTNVEKNNLTKNIEKNDQYLTIDAEQHLVINAFCWLPLLLENTVI